MITGISPSVTRVLNTARYICAGSSDWKSLSAYLEAALDDLGRIKEVFETVIFPPLVKIEDSQKIKDEFDETVKEQDKILKDFLLTSSRREAGRLPELSEKLDNNSIRLLEIISDLKQKDSESFKASPVRLLSDLILNGIEISRKKASPDLLRKKLPDLYNYIKYVESTIEELKSRFPDEEVLTGFFERQLERLKQAAGGIYIFLEEGGAVSDLVIAVSLLDRAGMDLWAAYSALNQLYFSSCKYSVHPVVEDAFRALEKYKNKEIEAEEMEKYLRNLKILRQMEASEAVFLEEHAFLKPAVKEEFLPQMIDTLNKMELTLAFMKDNLKSPAELEDAVKEYHTLLLKQLNLREKLAEKIHTKQVLEDSANFTELLDLIMGAFYETVPDARLEKKVIFLASLQEDFRRRLIFEEKRLPESYDSIHRTIELLDKQLAAFQIIMQYLMQGDKSLLPSAYAEIEETAVELIKLHNTFAELAEKEESLKNTITCPFCSKPSPVGSRQCSACGKPFPVTEVQERSAGSVFNLAEEIGDFDGFTSTGVQIPEKYIFLKQIIEETISGLLTYDEAKEMLQPFIEQLNAIKKQLSESADNYIETINDAGLKENYLYLKEALNYYHDSLQEIFRGIEGKNPEILKNALASVEEAIIEIQRLHNTFTELG